VCVCVCVCVWCMYVIGVCNGQPLSSSCMSSLQGLANLLLMNLLVTHHQWCSHLACYHQCVHAWLCVAAHSIQGVAAPVLVSTLKHLPTHATPSRRRREGDRAGARTDVHHVQDGLALCHPAQRLALFPPARGAAGA